jgi:hypothetical protein
MRLLRLTTEDDNAIFSNDFNSDIKLEPESQLGLQNINFQLEHKFINVVGSNNGITFNMNNNSAGFDRTVRLRFDAYDDNNLQDLLTDITQKLNSGLVLNALEIGIMWKARIIDNFVNIEYRGSGLNFIPNDFTKYREDDGNDFRIVNPNDDVEEITLDNSGNATATNINCLTNETQAFTKGCGMMSVRVQSFSDNGSGTSDNGFIIGLASKPPSEWGQQIPDNVIRYAVKLDRFNTNYQIKSSETGNFVDSGQGYLLGGGNQATEEQRDEIEFINESGNFTIGLTYWNNNLGIRDDLVLLGSGTQNDPLIPMEHTVDLFPFIIIRGASATTKLEAFQMTVNPFSLSKNNTFPPTFRSVKRNQALYGLAGNVRTGSGSHPNMKNSDPTPQRQAVINMTQDLGTFLGYDPIQQAFPLVSSRGTQFNFVAEDLFVSNRDTTFLLELLDGLDLESYDGLSNNRRNILAVMPVNVDNNIVIYEPNNVNFINLKNKETRIIRNLRARIVSKDLNPISVVGLSTATLLIRETKDRGF